jgi:ABC-type oligopeptide transport system substrate-binding subunit
MGRSSKFVVAATLVAVSAITLAACSSNSSSPSGGSAGTVKTGGTITMALDQNLTGLNVNTTAASQFVLQEILDTVWPQPYITNAALKPVLNTDLISSVKVAANPQTITYTINPKAVWQDGTPINADDFIYNWQAQSGDPKFLDVGAQPYDSASASGYNRLQSAQRRGMRRRVGGQQRRGPVPERQDRNGQVHPDLRRLERAVRQPGAGPHLSYGRLEHRVHRAPAGHLRQLVLDPEL